MLRLLAEELRVGIREHEHATIRRDRSVLATRVARQARMTTRMHIAGADPLPGFERGANTDLAPCGNASFNHRRNHRRRQLRRLLRGPGSRRAAVDLRLRHEAHLDDLYCQSCGPSRVVRHPQVFGWRETLDFVPAGIDIPPPAAGTDETRQGI